MTPRLDFLSARRDIVLDAVRHYRDYLIHARAQLYQDFGQIDAPEELENAIQAGEFCVKELGKAGPVSLEDEAAVFVKTAYKDLLESLEAQAQSMRDRGATAEMLKSVSEKVGEVQRILAMDGYQRLPDIRPYRPPAPRDAIPAKEVPMTELPPLVSRIEALLRQADEDARSQNWGTYDQIISEYDELRKKLMESFGQRLSWLNSALPEIKTVPSSQRGGSFMAFSPSTGRSISGPPRTGVGTTAEKAKYSEIKTKLGPLVSRLKDEVGKTERV